MERQGDATRANSRDLEVITGRSDAHVCARAQGDRIRQAIQRPHHRPVRDARRGDGISREVAGGDRIIGQLAGGRREHRIGRRRQLLPSCQSYQSAPATARPRANLQPARLASEDARPKIQRHGEEAVADRCRRVGDGDANLSRAAAGIEDSEGQVVVAIGGAVTNGQKALVGEGGAYGREGRGQG